MADGTVLKTLKARLALTVTGAAGSLSGYRDDTGTLDAETQDQIRKLESSQDTSPTFEEVGEKYSDLIDKVTAAVAINPAVDPPDDSDADPE
jgi:hypothetical protein